MLDLIEKISHGACGLIVAAVGTLYLVFGTPDTHPREFVARTLESSVPPPSRAPAETGGTPGTAPPPPAPAVQDRVILEELRKSNPQISTASRLEKKYMQVQPASFEFARKEANWMPELKRARSQLLPTRDGYSRLELTRVAEDSLLRTVARLQEGDVIEMINGERWDFNDRSTVEYRHRALEMFETLENGGEVSVTITRNGAPIHMSFRVQ